MADLQFVLSPPEAVEQFREIAKILLEQEGELSSDLNQQMEEKAQALGVHRVDMQNILREMMQLDFVQAAIERKRRTQTRRTLNLKEVLEGVFSREKEFAEH